MTIATFDDYATRVRAGQRVTLRKDTNGSGPLVSAWRDTIGAGSIPSTATAPTAATAGALPFTAAAGDRILAIDTLRSFLSSSNYAGADSNAAQQTVVLCDRLSHQGGLVGNTLLTQTTNLPTAALTRYTSGEGVMACLEVYSSISAASNQRVVVSYTNQAGAAGRTSPEFEITHGVGSNQQLNFVPLQAGDTGIRSVESVTMQATAGAGNFGVTLFKPLMIIPMPVAPQTYIGSYDATSLAFNLVELAASACLWFVRIGANMSTVDYYETQFVIGRDA